VASPKVSTELKNFLQPASLATPDVAWCAFCFLRDESTPLALVQLGSHSNPQVLFSVAAIQSGSFHPEFVCGVVFSQG